MSRTRLLTTLMAITVLQGTIALATEMPTVLITGTSRGIGLELARQYAERG